MNASRSENWSIAFDDIPDPDFADAQFVSIPETQHQVPTDPAWWARQVFSVASAPAWVRALLGLRQALVGVIGVQRGDASVFEVDRVETSEALIAADDRHLDFRAAVGIDSGSRILRVTTTVRLHGWRGKLYFGIVSWLHGPVTRSMAKRAVTRFVART